jgi:hypothetical protein
MHLYNTQVWQSASNLWYCNDTTDLANGSGNWWIPCRMLGITPAEFVYKLKLEFNIAGIHYNKDKNVLTYYWNKEASAKKYMNYINAYAKAVNYFI